MSLKLVVDNTLPPMNDGQLCNMYKLHKAMEQLPQIQIETTHTLHAGLYARTVHVPRGVLVMGVLIARATLLIVHGHATVIMGDRATEINGHAELRGAGGRKQAALAHSETYFTMVFPTDAATVEEAEAEFTTEAEQLQTRQTQGAEPCPE